MGTVGQIIGFIIAICLFRLAYKLYDKDKAAAGSVVITLATVILFCSFTWFQGWAKAVISSNIISELKKLGDQVNTVQDTTTQMQTQLSNHQNEINTFQTNLVTQQQKLSDVEYWVQNLFNNVTNEDFEASDTNRILEGSITDNKGTIPFYFIRLDHVPIKNSVEGYWKTKPLEIEQRLFFAGMENNIYTAPMMNFEKTNTSLSFRYVIDNRETNFFTNMPEFISHIILTNNKVILTPLKEK